MKHKWPSYQDILKAREIIQTYLPRTPLYSYPQLNDLLGTKVYIKHENHLPTVSFKVRGGINLMHNLKPEERKRGVVTASTGNHALSIATAGRLFDVSVTIVMPENANPVKVAAVRSLGPEIIFHGRIFEQSKDHASALAAERGARFIHPANEPYLIAGVASYTAEILEDCPDLDVIIVPVGGGSGAAGCCLAKAELKPSVQVIGVQAEKAPAAYLSWKTKSIVTDKMETAAEGLQTQMGYELTQEILQKHLADFILVSEEEMSAAILTYLQLVRNISEEAGASPLAAALKIKDRLQGKTVALILSGSNISLERLRIILKSSQSN
ncbi:MAG: threonine ammonia-lyase [Candidatus Aminicenantes bacterium RBG_19FT_COMBO_58_17]|nr:MAG: threonine ammonia-lyase [Candidatus Aminicenantes bacterium RBG_19FT_COMBO_58_17]HCS47732.1 threonine ammonia-lyase [Candidatus Aminicenantes bacterium]